MLSSNLLSEKLFSFWGNWSSTELSNFPQVPSYYMVELEFWPESYSLSMTLLCIFVCWISCRHSQVCGPWNGFINFLLVLDHNSAAFSDLTWLHVWELKAHGRKREVAGAVEQWGWVWVKPPSLPLWLPERYPSTCAPRSARRLASRCSQASCLPRLMWSMVRTVFFGVWQCLQWENWVGIVWCPTLKFPFSPLPLDIELSFWRSRFLFGNVPKAQKVARLQGMGPDLRMKAKAELAAALGRPGSGAWVPLPSSPSSWLLSAAFLVDSLDTNWPYYRWILQKTYYHV